MKVAFILQAKLCSRPCSASNRGRGPQPSSRVRSSPTNTAKATGDKLEQRSTKKSWAKAARPDAPVSMKMIPLEVVHARGPPYIFQVHRLRAAPRSQKIDICLPAVFPKAQDTINSVETSPESASPIEGIEKNIDEDNYDFSESANVIPR